MSEMIERVAEAIFEAHKKIVPTTVPWIDLTLKQREASWYPYARAAISAMREPTDEMRLSGTIYWDAADGTPLRAAFDPMKPYLKMIDAALK